MGRPLPAVYVSYPVVQVKGQLSGGENARPTCSSRPTEAGGSLLSEQPVCPENDLHRRRQADG